MMTSQNTKHFKKEFFTLLESFENQKRFQIVEAIMLLSSETTNKEARENLAILFMEFITYFYDRDWLFNFEFFKEHGILSAGKVYSGFQGNVYFESNLLGTFTFYEGIESPLEFTVIPNEEIPQVSSVLNLVFATMVARNNAVKKGLIKI